MVRNLWPALQPLGVMRWEVQFQLVPSSSVSAMREVIWWCQVSQPISDPCLRGPSSSPKCRGSIHHHRWPEERFAGQISWKLKMFFLSNQNVYFTIMRTQICVCTYIYIYIYIYVREYRMYGCRDVWDAGMHGWMDGFMDGWMGMLSRLRVATISSHKYETVPSLIWSLSHRFSHLLTGHAANFCCRVAWGEGLASCIFKSRLAWDWLDVGRTICKRGYEMCWDSHCTTRWSFGT